MGVIRICHTAGTLFKKRLKGLLHSIAAFLFGIQGVPITYRKLVQIQVKMIMMENKVMASKGGLRKEEGEQWWGATSNPWQRFL